MSKADDLVQAVRDAKATHHTAFDAMTAAQDAEATAKNAVAAAEDALLAFARSVVDEPEVPADPAPATPPADPAPAAPAAAPTT